MDLITDQDIEDFRSSTLIPEYSATFDQLTPEKKLRIVFLDKLPDDELLKLARFSLKKGPMLGTHGIVDEIRALSFCTKAERYGRILAALNG